MVAQSSAQPKVIGTATCRDSGHPRLKNLSRSWRQATELTPNQSLQPMLLTRRG